MAEAAAVRGGSAPSATGRVPSRGGSRVLAAVLLVTVGAACGDAGTEPGETGPLRLEAVWGHGASGLAGEKLLYPVMVRVTDVGGRPAVGVRVSFEPTAESGSVQPAWALTDALGRAVTEWRLGPAETRRQQLRASVAPGLEGSGAQLVLEATALGPDEADRIMVRGALGPLKGILLTSAEDGRLSVLREVATPDTVILLPPVPPMELDVLVFAYANRPLLERVTWTAGTDTVFLTLLPPVPVDVNVTVNAGAYTEVRARIEADLKRMEEVWVENAVGLRLGRVIWVDGTDGGAAGDGWDVSIVGLCGELSPGSAIQATFVGTLSGATDFGYGCNSGHVFLGRGWYRYPYLLAHEVGHTFTLQHRAFGLMNPTGPAPYLCLGEVFRAHFDRRSALNTVFQAQPPAARRLCLGPDTPCLPDDFEFSGYGVTSPASLPSRPAGWR